MMTTASGGQTHVVFVRFDPLLQNLLKLVNEYQQLEKELAAICNQEEFFSREERLIQLMKSLIEILEQIQDVLEQFGSPFAPSLIVLAKYFSLPLNAILPLNLAITTTTENQRTTTNSKNAEIIRRKQIRLGYVRKLSRTTAKLIQSYVQICSVSSFAGDEQIPTISLNDQTIKEFLVALIRVLPKPAPLKESDKASLIDALDDGSDTWMTLLHAIDDILRVCDSKVLEGGIILNLSDSTCFLTLSDNHELSLQALKLLHSLLSISSNEVSLWQHIFPGVFASLYGCLTKVNRKSPSGLTTPIECEAFELVQKLFLVALAPLGNHIVKKKEKEQPTSKDVLVRLQLLATSSNDKRQDDNATKSTLLKEVKTRLTHPLSVLLRQGVISPSERVRKNVLSLCRNILMKTFECWDSTNVPELALECCLILQIDVQDEISIYAEGIIQDYKGMDHAGMDSNWVTQKVHELIEKIPVFAQGSKVVELRSELQLLIGYISIVDSDSLVALSTSESLRRSLISLTDIDFEATNVQGVVTDMDITIARRRSLLQFRHLSRDVGLLARKMLRTLGGSIGFKRAAIMIDACISDFYEATLKQIASSGDVHAEFLHQWIGSIVVADEILVGAFQLPNGNKSITPKQEKRRCRILGSLASSVLPLLVESPLWNLPTNSFFAESQDSQTKTRGKGSLSTSSAHANACVVVLLLDFISTFLELLPENMDSIRSTVLYPIIAKANQTNSDLVQIAAHQATLALSKACKIDDYNAFICHELSSLLSTMFGLLHLPGGLSVPANGDLQDTLQILASTRWILKVVKKVDFARSPSLDKAQITGLIDLVTLLEDRFDHFSLRKLLSEENTLDLALLHQACFDVLSLNYGVKSRSLYTFPSYSSGSDKPWLELLSTFFKPSSKAIHTSMSTNAFERYTSIQSIDINMSEIELVSRLITKDNYLLSNKILKVQISACESLAAGYRFLAFISCNYEDKEDAQSTIQNSILRQSASSWPSVKARLHNVLDEIIGSKLVSLTMIVRSNSEGLVPSQDIATQRYFLVKIFTLVSTMCECGGDFMVNKFKHDVWPAIARYLDHILGKEKRQETAKRGNPVHLLQSVGELTTLQTKPLSSLSDSERHLLISIFGCLGRAIDILLLSETVLAPIGSILLPFLDSDYYHQDIASEAMNTLKKLVDSNCDILYRPLLELSGQGIPVCPLPSRAHSTPIPLATSKTNGSILSKKAQELLDYIDSLPEQGIN